MWFIVGITDERTNCEQCGRTGLKRTVVITDGETVRYVGTECASTMTGAGRRVRILAEREQARRDRAVQDEEWGKIIGAMHYNYLKLNVWASPPDRDKVRLGFARVVEQSGLTAETVKRHLEAYWGCERGGGWKTAILAGCTA